jgi:hypothetical protein
MKDAPKNYGLHKLLCLSFFARFIVHSIALELMLLRPMRR